MVRYGDGKCASHIIQGAKREQCLVLHGFGQDMALGQGVQCPEGGVGKHIVVYEPFQHGEVERGWGLERWCW